MESKVLQAPKEEPQGVSPPPPVAIKPLPVPVKKQPQEWEKPLTNLVNNYGPATMYSQFNYKNMNYEQACALRRKRLLEELNRK